MSKIKEKGTAEFPDWTKDRYVKKRYLRPIPEVGISFKVLNSKPGCYNILKVLDINDTAVKVIYVGYSGTAGSAFTVSMDYVRQCMDAAHRERWNRENEVRKLAYELGRSIGVWNIGGDLSLQYCRNQLLTKLEELKTKCERFRVDNSSVPAGGFSGANSMTMRSSKSGAPLTILINDYYRGGYYGVDFPFLIQAQVGGGIDSTASEAIRMVLSKMLSSYYLKSDIGSSSLRFTDGTNWSSVCLSAPYNSKFWTPLPK